MYNKPSIYLTMKQMKQSKTLLKKKIAIVGGGPGGLAASLLLAHAGHDVTIFESKDRLGGRSSVINVGEFHFDSGPTFFIYRYILDAIFQRLGLKLDDYVSLKKIEPLYDLIFGHKIFRPYENHALMMKEIHRVFPGEENGYQVYLKKEARRFKKLMPVLSMPFSSPFQFLHPKVLQAIDEIDISRSLYQRLSSYFHSEELIYSMAFQSKYLGMSPWECPSLFSILSFMEHEYGIYHIMGGLYHLNEVMGKLAISMGVKVKLNHTVSKFHVEKKSIKSIKVNQKTLKFDAVVMNGDFASTIPLLDNVDRPKRYQDQRLNQLQYSCSTFNLYLGLDKVYPIAHHTIVFSKDYRQYVQTLTKQLTLSSDPSFYLHNPSPLDSSYAPKGQSALYVLVPVPNLKANLDWSTLKTKYIEETISRLEKVPGLKDIRKHIIEQHALSPLDWQDQYRVHLGANFNLSHRFSQLLYLRPHNQFQGIQNLYLVGGGTHPGSGLPTIYQSAIIASDLINR
jgi:phytoene desaturase